MCRKRNITKTTKIRTTTTRSDAKRNENETPEIKRGARPIWAWLDHDPSTDPSVRSPPVRRPNLSRIGDAFCVENHDILCSGQKHLYSKSPNSAPATKCDKPRLRSSVHVFFSLYCFFSFLYLTFLFVPSLFFSYISLFNLRIFLFGSHFLDYN